MCVWLLSLPRAKISSVGRYVEACRYSLGTGSDGEIVCAVLWALVSLRETVRIVG